MEESKYDRSMPFLDTLVRPQPDGSFSTTVYRKSIYTDLYLQWDSNHTIGAKYSVVNTLHHTAKAVCSNSQLLEKEEDHLQKVLLENKYPNWALNRVLIQQSKAPYGGVICKRAEWRHKKCMQKTWGKGILQGR